MPIIPIRGVGEVGVVTDQNPQDTPLAAWTDAKNVRFAQNIVSRYSVFRNAQPGYTYAKAPVGVVNGSTKFDGYLVTVFSDGTMEQLQNGATTDVTPTGASGTSTDQITTTTLGGVTYVNRGVDVPYFRDAPGSGDFQLLTGWGSADRCKSLRAYKDFLIAINVSKSGIDYGGMVKWSNAAQYGAPPADWSVTDPASLAGETVLNDLNGELVDGAALGDSFIVYGFDQTYRMDFIGTPFIFRFQKIFDDQGIMALNCAVEVDGRHYVFGKTDIYVHDGVTKQSLVNERIAKRIFSELDYDSPERCFVYHDRVNGEVAFCYPSRSDDVIWPSADISGCNKAAVFNYRFNTWTFVDLPSAVGTTEVALTQTADWESFSNWNITFQTWAAFNGSKPKNLLVCSSGNGVKEAQSYFLDNALGGLLPNPIDEDILWPAYAESLYRDLDEIAPDIYGRKLLRRLVPQYRFSNNEDEIVFVAGQSPAPGVDISWGNRKTLTGKSQGKYDLRVNGRYLSFRVEIPAGKYAEFSGYDADIQPIAGR